MKIYKLQIGGKEIDTGTHVFFADADETVRNPKVAYQVGNARSLSELPPDVQDKIYCGWCVGDDSHNIEAIASAKSAAQELRQIPLKKRAKALANFGRDEILKKPDFWRALSVQEFHTENAWAEEHKSLDKLFAKKATKAQVARLKHQQISRHTTLTRAPYGVFGAITPSRTSYAMLTAMLHGAVLSGNSVVIKPPKDSPIIAIEMAQRFEKYLVQNYSFPSGMFNVVMGNSQSIVQEWISNPNVNGIFYMGGVDTGKHIYYECSKAGKKIILEANGADAVYVHRDARNLNRIAESIAKGRFTASGQFCIGVKRVFAHKDIYNELVGYLAQHAEEFMPGLPSDPKATLVPVGKVGECDGIIAQLEAEGATVLCGNERINYMNERDANGMFFRPTVVGGVPMRSDVILQEIFMPIMPVVPTNGSLQDTIYAINRSPFKMKSTIYSQDNDIIAEFINGVNVGAVNVNGPHLAYGAGYIVGGGGGLSSMSDGGARHFAYELTKDKVIHTGRL